MSMYNMRTGQTMGLHRSIGGYEGWTGVYCKVLYIYVHALDVNRVCMLWGLLELAEKAKEDQ